MESIHPIQIEFSRLFRERHIHPNSIAVVTFGRPKTLDAMNSGHRCFQVFNKVMSIMMIKSFITQVLVTIMILNLQQVMIYKYSIQFLARGLLFTLTFSGHTVGRPMYMGRRYMKKFRVQHFY